jgi:hypothetical protein
MNKDQATRVFEQMREETPDHIIKNISDKPNTAGQYTVAIEGVRTIRPLTLNYDGENWVGLEEMTNLADGNISKISYYDNPPVKKLKM